MAPEITNLSRVLQYKKVLGAHFPAGYSDCQLAQRAEWRLLTAFLMLFREDTVWAGKADIPVGDVICSWFLADKTEVFSSLGIDNFCFIFYGFALPICQTDQSSGRTSQNKILTECGYISAVESLYLIASLCSKTWFRQTLDHVQAPTLCLWIGNFLVQRHLSVAMNCMNPVLHVTLITQPILQHQGAGQAAELNWILSFCCSHASHQASSEYVHLPIYVLQKHPYNC